jgi:hypothetical protein
MVIFNDFLLPIILGYKEDYYDYDDEKYEKEDSIFSLILGVGLSCFISVLTSAYTLIIVYSTTRRQYITGDFLYDKSINDDLSLIKTVQLICGFSFGLIYCNLYFWKALDTKGDLGKPYFYQETIIPDYTIYRGISVYMIAKIIVIIFCIIGSLCCPTFSFFKNDLAEYILSRDECDYDKENIFKEFLIRNKKIVDILNIKIQSE